MVPSLQSKILTCILKVINFKKIVERRVHKQIPRSRKGFIPRRIKRSYSLAVQAFNSKTIATFENRERSTNKHIIFLHGGAYLFEATSNHWRLAEKIVKKSFCRMTLIDYPLAPEYNYKETFGMLQGSYEFLISKYHGDNFILMGDSAGGGLALAFTQKLIKEKHKILPAGNILLSPWLDMTMSNPDIRNLEKSDYLLSCGMLRTAGLLYSNGDDRDHYLLSPINGGFKDIPRTIVFYGTEELFRADCIKLKSIPGSGKENIVFKEYPKMQHDWAIFPIPERELLVDDICEFLNK